MRHYHPAETRNLKPDQWLLAMSIRMWSSGQNAASTNMMETWKRWRNGTACVELETKWWWHVWEKAAVGPGIGVGVAWWERWYAAAWSSHRLYLWTSCPATGSPWLWAIYGCLRWKTTNFLDWNNPERPVLPPETMLVSVLLPEAMSMICVELQTMMTLKVHVNVHGLCCCRRSCLYCVPCCHWGSC